MLRRLKLLRLQVKRPIASALYAQSRRSKTKPLHLAVRANTCEHWALRTRRSSRWEDPVQAVLAGSQVASGTHAGIYLGPSDIGCQYARSIYTVCFIVWQPGRAADTSTNWRQSLFCCCTESMEQATDGAETAAIDGLVSSWSENIFVSVCLRAPGYGVTLWCALGLLVGAQYKRLSYSYSCNDIICYASSQSLSSTTDAKSNLLTMPFKASKVSVLCQRVWMRGKLVSLVV